MMNNIDILNIAVQQSAIDSNCCADDFKSFVNKVVISKDNLKARKYLELPFCCDLTSYGNNIVASVSGEISEIVGNYINKFPVEHCLDVPNLHVLIEKLQPFHMSVCFMAEYFLPDMTAITKLDCHYETRIMTPEDFQNCYLPQWGNALCADRRHLDVLAVGAFDNEKLIGLAGCSADCETMWQIGVDVLPEYRKQGVASCLTNQLIFEVLERNIVPFYCCAWSNIKSVRNAIKSGLKPAWAQVTIKPIDFINKMNL